MSRAANFAVHVGQDMSTIPVYGVTSRGFMFGSLLAFRMKAPFIPVRLTKKTPIPRTCVSHSLEYGTSELALNDLDMPAPDCRAAIVFDDVLATGGTVNAVVDLLSYSAPNIEILVITLLDIGLITESLSNLRSNSRVALYSYSRG